MFSAIEIDNFKCIGRRIRVELAPLTLVFGANDAGKSAILQSFGCLRHLLQQVSTGKDGSVLGDPVDSPSFARLVHRHDLLRPICFRVGLGDVHWIETRVRCTEGPPERASISEFIINRHDATALILTALRDAIHIGAPRAIPPRDFPTGHDARRIGWTDGLAAWEALVADEDGLVDATNMWLERIGAGRLGSIPQSSDLGSRRSIVPCEAGSGLMQLVPIVVAALHGSLRGPILLEHPELSLHPALQVGLGDLFIEASRSRQIIVETHSEHLLLRILRRILETTENALPEGAPAFTPDQLSVIHLKAGEEGPQVQRLRVNAFGDFLAPWPSGFFEERAKELF
ncbi:MAG TPA: AAA family ATPase [Candidatus Nanopelagicales bacterium]|nr:AAA family ATPase [Candidatus Nanopelagicales bacterium]